MAQPEIIKDINDQVSAVDPNGDTMAGNLSILFGDTDKFINWRYSKSTLGGSWRIGALGSGVGDANYFVIQSTTAATGSSETWTNILKIGQNSFNISIDTTTNSTSTTTGSVVLAGGLGVAKDIYAANFIGNLNGNATTATKAIQDGNGSVISSTYLPLTGGTMNGTIKWPGNTVALNLRADHSSYDGIITYQTTGNEAMVFSTKQLVTSFIFINGEDTITNNSSSRWTSLTSPGLQIKNNCVSIGALWGNSITPDYKLKVTGNTYFNGNVTATGTIIGTLNGNATSATKATQDGNGNIITSTYLPLSGGTMTGTLKFNDTYQLFFRGKGNSDSVFCKMGFMNGIPAGVVHCVNSANHQTDGAFYITSNGYNAGNDYGGIVIDNEGVTVFGAGNPGNNFTGVFRVINEDNIAAGPVFRVQKDGKAYATALYGAVWNDYAEFRSSNPIEPGRVICETGNGTLKLSTERLQPGANVVSDTFGFAIGETENCKTPIAVSGRALVYTYEDRYSYEAGDPVCAAPGGTVSKMSREEVMMYPDRMVGTVSEIPEYERWGTGNVEVNGRIWIRIK